VSGTNGKTTTTALVAVGWGGEVVTNETGSNMPAGHVAALAQSNSPRASLEVDEAWLAEVIRHVEPRVVVLLNLSRDQLDRANEVRQMAERWRQVLPERQRSPRRLRREQRHRRALVRRTYALAGRREVVS
jgi:UDP-N-acetylmuramyl tripeptide synthase